MLLPHAMPMRPATMNWIAESMSASRPSERRADTAICKPRKKAEASMIASPIPKVSETSPAPENEMKPMPARASNAAAMLQRVGRCFEIAHAMKGTMMEYVPVRNVPFDAVVN